MKIAIVIALVAAVLASRGIDIADACNAFSCLKGDGYSFSIVRGYRSFGAVDKNAATSIANSKANGLITDTYYFPCSHKKSAQSQVDEFYNGLSI
jgi:hypothetical protein